MPGAVSSLIGSPAKVKREVCDADPMGRGRKLGRGERRREAAAHCHITSHQDCEEWRKQGGAGAHQTPNVTTLCFPLYARACLLFPSICLSRYASTCSVSLTNYRPSVFALQSRAFSALLLLFFSFFKFPRPLHFLEDPSVAASCVIFFR